MGVTLHMVDLWQYYECIVRSGVIRCTLIMVLYTYAVCASEGYKRCFGLTLAYLCASTLQNQAVQTLYLNLWDWRVLRERSMLFIGLSFSILYRIHCFLFFFFLSIYRLVLWGCDLRTDMMSMHCIADLY